MALDGSRSTRRLTRISGRALALLVVLGPLVALRSTAEQQVPSCIEVRGEARYRNYGYDHIVHIDNHCAATAVCDVSTNVAPEVQRVTVNVGEHVEVLTFRGSPSRTFQIDAECGLIL